MIRMDSALGFMYSQPLVGHLRREPGPSKQPVAHHAREKDPALRSQGYLATRARRGSRWFTVCACAYVKHRVIFSTAKCVVRKSGRSSSSSSFFFFLVRTYVVFFEPPAVGLLPALAPRHRLLPAIVATYLVRMIRPLRRVSRPWVGVGRCGRLLITKTKTFN